jgi:hypothetical protein
MIAASLPLIPSIAGESGRRWRVTAGASMREGLAPAVSAASSLNDAVVVEKRHDVIQGGLRGLSIHVSRIITAVDPVLTLPFELVHRFAQQEQRCELVQFFCQLLISRRESGTRQRLCSLRILDPRFLPADPWCRFRARALVQLPLSA